VTALLYDIHGNLPALEAVLEDVAAQGEERFLLGGDYALFGAWPAETVARLRELDAVWIRGNGERWTAHPEDAPDVAHAAAVRCGELLGEEVVDALAALPETYTEAETMFCHGSPKSDVRSFLPEPGEDEDELLEGVPHERLVFGHTHLAFARQSAGGIQLVNPGSVGMPFDGDPRAAWARLHEDGSIEHRRVGYDHMASAEAARRVLGEAGEVPARRIERATFEVA
jgi:diadenosine tetraphosphatase ApaH/serine/threonine PP2A family protein phosphatase